MHVPNLIWTWETEKDSGFSHHFWCNRTLLGTYKDRNA